jgi:hypothetical protein
MKLQLHVWPLFMLYRTRENKLTLWVNLENNCTLKWISSLDTQTPIHSGLCLRTQRALLPCLTPIPLLADPTTTWTNKLYWLLACSRGTQGGRNSRRRGTRCIAGLEGGTTTSGFQKCRSQMRRQGFGLALAQVLRW